MNLDWFGLAAWALLASPFYFYLNACLISSAWFKAKLRYHQSVVNEMGLRSNQGSN
jgi:hypothetical protein